MSEEPRRRSGFQKRAELSRRGLWPRLALVCGALLVLLAADAALWRRYVGRLEQRRPAVSFAAVALRSGVPEDVLNSIGSVAEPRAGRFTEASRRKPAGVVRIGAFGDSFTDGYNVAPGLDFPSLLARRLRAAGRHDVEVINFGNPWHGLHQIYRFWETFGRGYDLDYVLVGPAALRVERDATFNHGEDAEPYYLHGRYVLNGGDAAFVDVSGGRDFDARFRDYFRFLPRWDYLRYDLRPPAFLQCLLPRRRTLRNPFYYSRKSVRRELTRIAGLLLGKMSDSSRQVVVFDLDHELSPLAVKLSSKLVLETIPLPRSFPYWARKHPTAMGNALIAKAYADVLRGRDPAAWNELEFSLPRIAAGRGEPVPLDRFASADLSLGGADIGTFADVAAFGVAPRIVDFRARGIRALLALSVPGGNTLDALYFPLDFDLRPGMRLELLPDATAPQRRIPLGEASLFDPRVAIGQAGFSAAAEDRSRRPNRDRARRLVAAPDWPARLGIAAGALRSPELLLDGRAIGRIVRSSDGRWELAPIKAPLIEAAPRPTSFADADRLGRAGSVTITLRGRGELRAEFASWAKREVRFRWPESGLHRRL